MLEAIGQIEAIYRYPVKSMRGERLESARLGYHGIKGDRRLALRRVDDRSGFPWLTASTLPELIAYLPQGGAISDGDELPTHIRTPRGEELPVFGEQLAGEIGRRHGAPVEMMYLRHGIFDDAFLSVISTQTAGAIAQRAGTAPDARRFRPNVVVHLDRPEAFQEDAWLGRRLSFGEDAGAAIVSVIKKDVRCVMINLDPETAAMTPGMLQAAGEANQACAGIYAAVIRAGSLAPGVPVFLI